MKVASKPTSANSIVNTVQGSSGWASTAGSTTLNYTITSPINFPFVYLNFPYSGSINSIEEGDPVEDRYFQDIGLALAAFSRVANINFVSTGYFSADLKFTGVDNLNDNGKGFAGVVNEFPRGSPNGNPKDLAGTGEFESFIFLNTSFSDMITASETGGGHNRTSTIIHELGHSLGLGHPHDGGNGSKILAPDGGVLVGDDPLDNQRYTIMSYERGGIDDSVRRDYGHAVTPMAIDIAAIQNMYGKNTSTHTEATTYALFHHLDSGAALDVEGEDGLVSIGRAFYCIWDWDLAGIDDEIVYAGVFQAAINLNDATLDNKINSTGNALDKLLADELVAVDALFPLLVIPTEIKTNWTTADHFAGGYFSRVFEDVSTVELGGYSIAKGVTIENARGNLSDDILVGNEAKNFLSGEGGSDFLFGGSGNDFLEGGAGNDFLFGGTGAKGGTSDVCVLSGDCDDYDFAYNSVTKTWTVTALTGSDGVDTLTDIEFVKFGDGSEARLTPGKPVCGPTDLVLVIDTTGSMGEEIAAVKAAALDIINSVLGPSAHAGGRIAIVGFKDPGEQTTILSFTSNATAAQNAINSIFVSGGGDIPEGVYSGLRHALDGSAGAWNPDATTKRVVLFGDAPPNDTGLRTQVNSLATSLGATISSIVVAVSPGFDPGAQTSFATIADDNGGRYAEIGSGGLGDEIIEAITAPEYNVIKSTDAGSTITGSIVSDRIGGFGGNDTLLGDDGNDFLSGGTGSDTLDGGRGDDEMFGGAGSDIFIVDSEFDETIERFNDGIDEIRTSLDFYLLTEEGNVENLTLTTEGGGYALGNSLSNKLTGTASDDTLDGSGGKDVLIGGKGDDFYFVDDIKDVVTEKANEGFDFVFSTAESYTLAANVEYLFLDFDAIKGFGNSSANVISGNDEDNTIDGKGGDDYIEGGFGADRLIGGGGNDILSYFTSFDGVDITLKGTAQAEAFGGDADGDVATGFKGILGSDFSDFLTGDGSANFIEGVGGGDFLDGGAGIDTLSYLNSLLGVFVELQDGLDVAAFVFGGDADGDSATNFENVTGSFSDDTLIGNSAANVILGDAGDDTISGGGGADTLNGGEGFDTLDYTDILGPLTITLGANGAATTVSGAGTAAAGDKISNFERVLSGSGNDKITGNALANILYGGDGNDTLIGGAGADELNGQGNGTAGDTVSYATSATGVRVDLDAGTGEGGDAQDDIIGDIENVIGSAKDDLLFGTFGSNHLAGGAGNDEIEGRDGADVLKGEAGTNTLSYASDTVGVIVSLKSGGQAIVTATGSHADGDVATGFQNLLGGSGVDILVGDTLANRIEGGAAGDFLDGGAGIDTLSYSRSGSGVVVFLGEGLNAAGTSFGDAAGDTAYNFENVAGSNFNDLLGGNSSANVLDGSFGEDILYGDLGADTLIGGSGFDIVNYQASTTGVTLALGKDGALSTGSGTGSHAAGDKVSGIEGITGSELFNDTLTGNNLTNKLEGRGGDDVIQGGAGADILDGASGIDTLSYSSSLGGVTIELGELDEITFGSGGDAEEAGEEPGDIAYDSIVNFENLIGSAFADKLTGNSGANNIQGGAGNDVLEGAGGADILTGGAGKDFFVYGNASEGGDSIVAYTVADDTLRFSASGFGGGLSAGVALVNGSNFVSNLAPSATTGLGTFLYETDTRQLSWDADGMGAGGPVLIATFSTATALTVADFDIVV